MTMFLFNIELQLLLIAPIFSLIVPDCPRYCDCKWKSGKESVICSNANLTQIPHNLDAGTQVLDLTSNILATVKHDEFSQAGLLNLQKIFLSKCNLKSLDRYAFRNLINLVELDLSYNALPAVPSHVFDSIPELRELKLSGNPIQRILSDAFTSVPQLVRLELSDCKIGNVEPGAFGGLEKSLEFLKLDNNKLVEVKSDCFTILYSLHGIELAGNPWNCSCTLRPLREWMLRENVPFGIPPACRLPTRLASKTWDKLDLDEFACVPEILATDSRAHGIEGKNVTMTCHIGGIPEPTVRWLLKNKVIANLSGSPFSNGKKFYTVHLQNNASDLTILTADVQDAGVYVCSAENKAGKVEASVTLAVSRRPIENSFSGKVLIGSAITGTLFALASCLIAMCVCTVRKRQVLRWRNRKCREDNYEKIEMNHKVLDNGASSNVQGEISVVGHMRRHGDYCLVPGTEEETQEEENEPSSSKPWNSPLLDVDDLHIPRRTLKETRGDCKKTSDSTSGIYKLAPLQAAVLPQTFQAHVMKKQMLENRGSLYTSALPSLDEKTIPDLIENSKSNLIRASSEGGSVSDITDLYCTLPKKSLRYRSTDSESPLLPESRYGSGESERRLSDTPKSSYRVNQRSNSYLNLTIAKQNFCDSENRVCYKKDEFSPSSSCAKSYDYHAAQLERFLEEYRVLQKQLSKMKETCENLQQDKASNEFVDPLQRNSPVTPLSSHDSILKKSGLIPLSPNSCQVLDSSLKFLNYESDLAKYLLSKDSDI